MPPEIDKAPQRLCLVIPALTMGGAERVLSRMANHWAGTGRHVTLITWDGAEHDSYALSSHVHRVGLNQLARSRGLLSAVHHNWRRVRVLRNALIDARPDVVISFLDTMNVTTGLACLGTGIPVIATERTDPRQHRIGFVWNMLRRWTYPRCSALVVQTAEIRRHFVPPLSDSSVCVIPNAVFAAEPSTPPSDLDGRSIVLGVGRLSNEKGFDLLIEAFAGLADDHPHWRLVILGDGPQRQSLEQDIRRWGLQDRMELRGWVTVPSDWYAAADVFVLPSRYEGFPNALLEAMASGSPVIATNCSPSIREIIDHDQNGLVVQAADLSELSRALRRMMTDADLRNRLGTAARQVSTRFCQKAYFQKWESLIDSVLAQSTTADASVA